MKKMTSLLSILSAWENLTHAVSGAIAGVTAISVFYPLETVRTRKQMNQVNLDDEIDDRSRRSYYLLDSITFVARIFSNEGLPGLYKGYSAVVFTLWCSNFVYFYAYVCLKDVFESWHTEPNVARNSFADLLTSFLASSVTVLVTAPLWVANTRIKLQGVVTVESEAKTKKDDDVVDNDGTTTTSSSSTTKYHGLLHALKAIKEEEGFSALYSGMLPSLILCTNPALQWTFYEFLKLRCQRLSGNVELSGATYFLISAIAKFLSTTSTYPLQVVQTRMRFEKNDDSSSSSTTAMLKTMLFEEGGCRGLFAGFESKVVQTVSTTAFMITIYEKLASFLVKTM